LRSSPNSSQAIVLRQIIYGESDLIVSLLSAEHGIIRGFAHGGRRSVKRFGSALAPFSTIDVRWQSSRTELVTFLDADLLSAREAIRHSVMRLGLAYYAVELLEMLLNPGESQPILFRLLQGYLDALAEGENSRQARLLFELRLVQQLGYIPHLLHCSECFVQFSHTPVAFDPARGGSLCPACAKETQPLLVALGTLGSLSRSLRTEIGLFRGFKLGSRTLHEGTMMLAQVMASILPRQVKSLRFLAQITGSGES
jgi:DNA repair protein RecO (recombination protein O)